MKNVVLRMSVRARLKKQPRCLVELQSFGVVDCSCCHGGCSTVGVACFVLCCQRGVKMPNAQSFPDAAGLRKSLAVTEGGGW